MTDHEPTQAAPLPEVWLWREREDKGPWKKWQSTIGDKPGEYPIGGASRIEREIIALHAETAPPSAAPTLADESVWDRVDDNGTLMIEDDDGWMTLQMTRKTYEAIAAALRAAAPSSEYFAARDAELQRLSTRFSPRSWRWSTSPDYLSPKEGNPLADALKFVEQELRGKGHVAEGADNCAMCHILKAITDPIPCKHDPATGPVQL